MVSERNRLSERRLSAAGLRAHRQYRLPEGKTLVRIAPDGTQTELPFEAKNGKLIFTLDFANSALPVMLFRLLPQTAAL